MLKLNIYIYRDLYIFTPTEINNICHIIEGSLSFKCTLSSAGLETLHDPLESIISNKLFSDIQNPAHRLHSLLSHHLNKYPVNLKCQRTFAVQPPYTKSAPKFYLSPCDEPFLVE